jgi:hypothetical protein
LAQPAQKVDAAERAVLQEEGRVIGE